MSRNDKMIKILMILSLISGILSLVFSIIYFYQIGELVKDKTSTLFFFIILFVYTSGVILLNKIIKNIKLIFSNSSKNKNSKEDILLSLYDNASVDTKNIVLVKLLMDENNRSVKDIIDRNFEK